MFSARSFLVFLATALAVQADTKLFLAKSSSDAPAQPIEVTVPAGERVTLAFPILSGNLWLKDEDAIAGANGRTLVIEAARLEDAGRYRVMYDGDVVSESQELVLKVAPEAAPLPPPRFLAFTARGVAGAGPLTMVAGFVIDEVPGDPNALKPVLIRAIGPTLAEFGVQGALAAPQLTLHSSTGDVLNAADVGAAALRSAEERAGAYSLLPGNRDASQLLYLKPGVYTAQVSSSDDSVGIVLLEIYEVPE